MSDTNETNMPNDTSMPNGNAPGNEAKSESSLHRPRRPRATRTAHLLFGSVEDLLADLSERGAPDGRVVCIERVVRNNVPETDGIATLGIAITARREDEVLSCWVIVGRFALDPWGQPTDQTRASALTARHHDAQRIIAALITDAGFDVRVGLYRVPEDCYYFAATCAALEQQTAAQSRAEQPRQTHTDRSGPGEELTSRDEPGGEHTPQQQKEEADDDQ